MRYILSLGSNKGDRKDFITKGFLFLSTLGNVINKSSLYETSPVGMNTETRNFYNAVTIIESGIDPSDFLKKIKTFENSMGRASLNSHMQPREIDIDILFADKLVVNTASLTIPHPELENRKFVLAPLAEILPDHIHPVSGQTVKELLGRLKTGEKIRIVKTEERSASEEDLE
ncbi:MAG: 2-amino-4-hydroxy-6-hydroxymethyldihydropteridine diphosphokinase [Acidobacteriota bacterium]